MRSYTSLITLPTFEERFEYLRLDGIVAQETFGFDRWMNQRFHKSQEWKSIRDKIIIRDNGCDLGIPDHPIFGRVIIHHLNPIGVNDIQNATEFLLNPEYLIATTKRTHDAIHYGDASLLFYESVVRSHNDTTPWR